MTAPRIVRLADLPAQPWRNGGGQTRELLALPSGEWRCRISVAEIAQDGPFSAFPGVQRWFAVLGGAGVRLAGRRLTPADAPLSFDGAEAPDCRLLGGPTQDLNLMLRAAAGRMLRLAAGTDWRPEAAGCGVYTAAAATCRAEGHAPFALPAQSLAWFDEAPACLQVDLPDGAAAFGLTCTPDDAHPALADEAPR